MLSCGCVIMMLCVTWTGTQRDEHCKYHNELCYKAPLCGMLSGCHYVLILSRHFIVNTTSS